MTSPRLLVLGAGRHQAKLIARAEERGIATVAVDYYPDAPGKRWSSIPELADALDVTANIELAHRHRVSGVVTTGTDLAVVTMAEVAAALGLPSYLSPVSARTATDKLEMASAFAADGIRRPRHWELDDPARLSVLGEARYPLVVKPADSQGQRGTSRVETPDGIGIAVAEALRWSRRQTAVVEEYVEGFEITVNAWVSDGHPHLLAVTDRVTYNPPPSIGIAFQHIFPSIRATGLLTEITRQVEGIAGAYCMEQGPLYIQMLVEGDDVWVVEAGGRVGGGHEASLIPMVTGVDLTDRMIDLALTGRADPVGYDYQEAAESEHALVNFLLAGSGTVASSSGLEQALADGSIVEGGFYVNPGHVHEGVVNSLGRVGYFIARDKTRSALLERSRDAYLGLSLLSDRGEEMLFWPDPELVNG